ncbi:MAG: beta-ketoacyl-[acyl-carrier-protein] synthase family protein [Propionibacteriaceae bacterium]|jgi:3-oxoacyl-[acyl-carrier-protein] synthase II|nr:beta-ketoacyl-[acyl-carrier-protein] synthase family protein [Propionibacteriaceae bacterium]
MSDVVVTGLSLITALGQEAEESWKNIQLGQCGIKTTTLVPTENMPAKVAAEIHSIELEDRKPVGDTPEDEAITTDRCHELAYHGVQQALESAGLGDLEARPYATDRVGITLGTLMGGARRAEVFQRQWIARGLENANTALLSQYPPHTVADFVARKFELMGPRMVPSNACAASAVAIAYAKELLDAGKADMVVAGGAEPLGFLAYGGFSCLEALDPLGCAPYSRSTGLTLGEGSAFLILERREDAEARGAKILAIIAGYGFSADAHHATAPDPKGTGAAQAVQAAIDMAGVDPSLVGYINGHGTGTPANDSSEPRAMRTVFGPTPPPMSSVKSLLGHTLGAAGAVETAVTILALRDQVLPPTLVPADAAPQQGLDIVPNKGRPAEFKAAVSTSFAFGGNNSCLTITTPDVKVNQVPPLREVSITGMGGIVAGAKFSRNIRQAARKGEPIYGSEWMKVANLGEFPVATVPLKNLSGGINPNYNRRLDPLSRRLELSVAELLKQRRLSVSELQRTGLFFATNTGPITSVEHFQEGLLKNGTGSAKIFPNTVMNAAPGHVALLHQIKGPTVTMCSGTSGAIAALWLAQRMIARGECDRIIVAAADEVTEALAYTYAVRPNYLSYDTCRPFQESGRLVGDGGAAIMLEATETVSPERVLGRIDGYGMTGAVAADCELPADESAWAASWEQALAEAGHDVDAVISAATGHQHIDQQEIDVMTRVGLESKAVFAPKGITGDISVVSPLIGVMWALWLSQTEEIGFGSYGYAENFGPVPDKVTSALVSSFDVGGNFHSVVVSAA